MTRLLWIRSERTIESFQGLFDVIGDELAFKIVFVCSDMWQPYLNASGANPELLPRPETAFQRRCRGLNNKAKVSMRKAYGFRTFRVLELALYRSLAKLPEPETTHDFF